MFSEASLWTVGLLVTVLMLAATELGFQIGRHRAAECDAGVGAVKAAVLALVGLLLAFSYSIAAGHYDRRVHGAVTEAKALKACSMRLALADEPARSRARELLRLIVDVRLESFASARNPPARRRMEEQVIGYHNELWALAAAQLDQSREPEKHLLLAQSVSDVIDRGGERAAAAENRVPSSVMYMLVTSILVSGFLIGLSSGQDKRRVLMLWAVVVVLMVGVLLTILDLDNPGRGLISDRIEAFVDLQGEFGKLSR